MKKILFPIAFALVIFATVSKNTNAQELTESYDRSGLTIIFTIYEGQQEHLFLDVLRKNDSFVPDKFFDNDVTKGYIKLPTSMQLSTLKQKEDYFAEKLEEMQLGQNIVGHWFNFDKDKGFTLDRLFERAEYNATDEEVMVSKASQRGLARIRDFGSTLIENSYVLFVDLTNIAKVTQEKDSDPYGWEARMGFYMYKLKFGDEEVTKVYDSWIYPEDNDSIKQEKINHFIGSSFDFKPVLSNGNNLITAMNYLSSIKVKKSFEELFVKMLHNSVDNATNKASKDLPKFQVKTKISARHPLAAKIGKKEGLKTDHRYFVYEYVWDENAGEALPNRKAVIRAKKVRDNRKKAKGHSVTSSFYQTYGGTVREGMTLVEKRALGLSVLGSYVQDGLGGLDIRALYRTGPFTGIPALYAMAGIGVANEDYNVGYSMYPVAPESQTFFRWNVGVGKGYQMFRIFELMPYITYGQETVSVDDEDYATYFLNSGFYAGISLLHNVMIFGDVNWTSTGEAMQKIGDEYEGLDVDWEDFVIDADGYGREGGMAFELGLRIEF